MPSSNFARFYESYFGDPYMAWHDGLDEEALLSLSGEEREEAERLLIEGMKTGDYRPAAGLAALRSPRTAELLRAGLPLVHGRPCVEVGLALWRMEEYRPAMEAIIGVLRRDHDWGNRLDAARALREVRTPESEAALWKALDDREMLVRYHSAASLLEMHGIPAGIEKSHPLTIKVMTEEKKERAGAIKELRALLRESK